MTDTEPRTPPADGAAEPSARTHPHLHPADATDDLTGNTEGGGPEPPGLPREGGPAGGPDSTQPDLTDDAADLTDGARETDDHTPGDGTLGSRPPRGDVDAMRTVARGREAEAARADTSDSAPTPTETHTD
jgi:hypothetical protein